MTVHEVLVRARNLIDREGWVQGALYRPGEGYCLLGAVRAVAPSYHTSDVGSELYRATGVPRKNNGFAPVGWNNAPGRTKEEVLAAFDAAIAATAPPPADPFNPSATPVNASPVAEGPASVAQSASGTTSSGALA